MKLIKNPQRCDCQARASEFQRNYEGGGGPLLRIGAEVQCECGTVLRLSDHQFDGPYWRPIRAKCGGEIR